MENWIKQILPSRFVNWIRKYRAYRFRIIFDFYPLCGSKKGEVSYEYRLSKEGVSRDYVFSHFDGAGLRFLDYGGGDGQLRYLLGHKDHLTSDETLYQKNKQIFDAKYQYWGVDLYSEGPNIITGDVCESNYFDEKYLSFFDVVYSNNVFEHLHRPWVAVENIYRMMKKDGIAIIVVPFSCRYHESPGDYFRYTHKVFESLFNDCGPVEVLRSGYDIVNRRSDERGTGQYNDYPPIDYLGGWREVWHTVTVLRKL